MIAQDVETIVIAGNQRGRDENVKFARRAGKQRRVMRIGIIAKRRINRVEIKIARRLGLFRRDANLVAIFAVAIFALAMFAQSS
jgi:hypothetical protein